MQKQPRQYATEILTLPSREQRQAALERVPVHLRDWVEKYVRAGFRRRVAR